MSCWQLFHNELSSLQRLFDGTTIQGIYCLKAIDECEHFSFGIQNAVLTTINFISYTLSREYRVAGYRYSRLLFTSEDRLCANLRVQWQLTNMTSQYLFLAFAWRHRSIEVTSQCWVRKCHPWQQWRNELSMIIFSGFVCSWHKIACKKWNNTFVTVNNDFLSLVRRFGNDFHSWLRHSWKSLSNRLTRDKNRYSR